MRDTGERIIEDAYQGSAQDYLIYLFHLATYRYALEHVEGRDVLDYGCGTGYGAQLLASRARSVVGVDVAPAAIEFAAREHVASNLEYRVVDSGERARLPFDDRRFGVVVSFQVIEHIRDDDSYLREIARVLAPGGVLLLATPDRAQRLFRFQKPWNAFHVREYSAAGLAERLGRRFARVEVLRMGARDPIAGVEARRVRRIRWATLPFTLPLVPEVARRTVLEGLMRLSKQVGGAHHAPRRWEFGVESISIGAEVPNSANLLALAHKGS